MNPKLLRTYLMLFCLLILLTGCASYVENSQSATKESVQPSKTLLEMPEQKTSTAVPSKTNTKTNSTTATLTPTIRSTNTLEPTEIITPLFPTWTPLPTLNAENVKQLLADLLGNNAGCRLPCFWGITPGKTTWQEASTFLESFTMLLGINNTTKGLSYAYFQVPFPKDMGTITHTYVFTVILCMRFEFTTGTLRHPFSYLNSLKRMVNLERSGYALSA
jgi:hypothetical protein